MGNGQRAIPKYVEVDDALVIMVHPFERYYWERIKIMKRIMALDDRGGLGGMIYPGALINRTPCQPGSPPLHTPSPSPYSFSSSSR